MSTQLFVATLAAIVSLAHCGNFTVTDEAWFEVEIKDMDGPGQDYRSVLSHCPRLELTDNFTDDLGHKSGNHNGKGVS